MAEEAVLITDRALLGPVINERLNKLDTLLANRQECEHEAALADAKVEAAEDEYNAMYDEVMASGWANEIGLAQQGHVKPRRDGRSRRHRAAKAAAAAAAAPHHEPLNGSAEPAAN